LQRQCPFRFPSTQNDTATIQALQKQLQTAQQTGDKGRVAGILNRLGDIYRVIGRYDESLKAFEQSIAAAIEIKAPLVEAASLGGISHVYMELGDYAEAATVTERSFQLRKGFRGLESLALNNLVITKTMQGEFAVANSYLAAGLALMAQNSPQTAPKNWLIGNQGNLEYVTKGASVALAHYDQISLGQLDRPNASALLNNRGLVYQSQEKFDLALQSYDAALKQLEPTNNTGCQWKTLSNRGRLLAQQGQTAAAIASYQQAIAITTKIWRDSVVNLPPKQQKAYRQIIYPIYQELATLWINQGKFAEADAVFADLKRL
jgi:tetratricopeptide (TPR) repeat protein